MRPLNGNPVGWRPVGVLGLVGLLLLLVLTVMAGETFEALVVEREPDGGYSRRIVERRVCDLPDGDVLIDVAYSSLNYKDALSASGHRGVTTRYPHTPGIDAAGVVRTSTTDAWAPGDAVIVTGHDLGMDTSGGLGGCIRVPGERIVPLPAGLTARESMVIGTAGFTAAASLHYLEHNGLSADSGEVLVTGATGGVGSFAVAMLSHLGYRVAALTGKRDRHGFLTRLGAREIIDRRELAEPSTRPLQKGRWAGVIDTVGGPILGNALAQLRSGGGAAICGLVASPELSTTVYPFILRNIGLFGVASADTPMPLRRSLWTNLAGPWKPPALDVLATEIVLSEVPARLDALLAGASTGRVVVRLS